MGVCASSGGFYRSYHVMQGIDEIVRSTCTCPAARRPESLIAGLMKIQDLIKEGRQAKSRSSAAQLGANGEGIYDAACAASSGPATTASAPRRACRRAGCSSSRSSGRRARRRSTVASPAPRRPSPRGPGQAGRAGARRGARHAPPLGHRLPPAISPSRSSAARGSRPHVCCATTRARLQAVPRPVRRRLPRQGRPAPSATRSCSTSTPSRRSTTCGSRRGARGRPEAGDDRHGLPRRRLVRARGVGPLRDSSSRATRTSRVLLTHDAFVGHPMRKDYRSGSATC